MKIYFAIIFIVVSSIGCKSDNPDSASEYFKKNKVGKSPDYGLMKYGNDHVATIHGFMDDYAACAEFAAIINRDAGENRYSCQKLNN